MPCRRMMLALWKYRLLNTQTGWRARSMRVEGMYLEQSSGVGLRIGVALCRPCTPYNPAHHSISHLKVGCRHPFRKPLQIIVMSVIGVISLYLKGFHMTVPK
jgi:hypothetical protein